MTDKVYGSRWELAEDIARIMGAEIQALAAEGVPYIQIDNAHYPDYIPEHRRQAWRDIGIDPDKAIDEDIRADNLAVKGLDRSKVTLANHICRGNGRSAWHTEGGYDPIAEKVFGGLDVDRFLLEYDSDRAGGFEPLRFVPKGKQVVLGLVTTKVGGLEKQDDLLRRIEEASKYVPGRKPGAEPRSAASPRSNRATCSAGTSNAASSSWSSTPPGKSGAGSSGQGTGGGVVPRTWPAPSVVSKSGVAVRSLGESGYTGPRKDTPMRYLLLIGGDERHSEQPAEPQLSERHQAWATYTNDLVAANKLRGRRAAAANLIRHHGAHERWPAAALRRPIRRDEGAAGRLLPRRNRRPGRRPSSWRARCRTWPTEARSKSDPSGKCSSARRAATAPHPCTTSRTLGQRLNGSFEPSTGGSPRR